MTPTESNGYLIYSIPSIPAEHHVLQYKTIRLLALKTNPEHFGSTYAQALTLDFKEWKSRIQSRDKVTIVAATRRSSTESKSAIEDDSQHNWVGLITIAGQKTLKRFGFVPPRSANVNVEGGEEYFAVFSVWVDPEHRRKGLGRGMIQSAIDWVQSDDVVVPGEAPVKRTMFLEVKEDNHEAIGLYSAMGFRFAEADEERVDDKNRWMYLKLGD